jgi:hypothetical protein
VIGFLEAISSSIVPECASLDDAGRAEARRIMEAAVASRAPAVRAQLSLFAFVLRWLPALRWARPLDALDAGRRDRALRWFQESPLAPVRKGFWGVRTIVMMGYYGQPAVGGKIGWRPSRDGNARLRGR